MAITLEEGQFAFTFGGDAIKFDDAKGYYGKYFKKLQGGKGVDFIALSSNVVQLIEVKDCRGHESDNLWRTITGNSKHNEHRKKMGDSFDVEVAKKVASTIACLYGAWTMEPRRSDSASKLIAYGTYMNDRQMQGSDILRPLRIVLFLEGDFTTQSRSKQSVMDSLQKSIQTQLSWLNCAVSVIDSDSCHMSINTGFTVADISKDNTK